MKGDCIEKTWKIIQLMSWLKYEWDYTLHATSKKLPRNEERRLTWEAGTLFIWNSGESGWEWKVTNYCNYIYLLEQVGESERL